MLKIKEETLKDIRLSWPYLIIISVMMLVGFSFQLYFYEGLDIRKELLPCFYFLSLIPFSVMFYHLRKKGKVDFRDIGFTLNKLTHNLMFGLTVGVFAGLLGWGLRLLLNIRSDALSVDQVFLIFLYLFVPMCICAPIWEEILCRGLFFTFVEKITKSKLKNRIYIKNIFIILVVSLFFLIAHFDRNVGNLSVIFITSIIFTVAYFRTRSIIVPIVAHSVYNLFVILNPLLYSF